MQSLCGTILLVDDEEALREALSRQLNADGHTVIQARDGLEALHLARLNCDHLDLVLTDAVMPGMNGTELAATLVSEFPGLPVILMSAYAPPSLTRLGFNQTVVPVLQKPLKRDHLAYLIQTALEVPELPRRKSGPALAI